jgi:hypothetical protein
MLDWEPNEEEGIGENLPAREMENLVVHILAAVLHAKDRQWVAGYDLLIAGLRAAEAHARQGAPWGSEAVCRFRCALNNYCRRFMPRDP